MKEGGQTSADSSGGKFLSAKRHIRKFVVDQKLIYIGENKENELYATRKNIYLLEAAAIAELGNYQGCF
jgi:hypothetical protein